MEVGAALSEEFGAVELLAEDGTSQVFRGTSEDGPVAVKVSRWPMQGVKELLCFGAEVRQMIALSAEGHLVPVLRCGFLPDGHPYVVTRLCAGGSVDRFMPLPGAVACEVVGTVGRAVAGLHRAGVVHGGIRPSKILVGRDGTAQLGLFGVDAVTAVPSHVVGGVLVQGVLSIAYLAPEIVYGTGRVPSADVYSLGAVLYGLITGRAPYCPPDRELSVGEQVGMLRRPVPENPAVPGGLLAVIRKAMRFEAGERHGDVDELIGEVARFSPAARG
ncbi:protein kinase [Dactylosporangium sp. NBC_01737]|uniref:protein kinase domain-containing protein n=1 Tax=Dactylosporangium sp. NBC_01737 TaxID=2975959 RepID=UPI002E131477|nr:protein kinase [Dactylosporangium sp. NBC_01737]